MKRRTHRGNPSFSVRLPPEVMAHVRDMAASRMIKKGTYVHALIKADMGTRKRAPSRQHVVLRRELANIHAAIIELGNRVSSGHLDCHAAQITDRIVELVATLLRLEDEVRGK
jgi:hypothetical protein